MLNAVTTVIVLCLTVSTVRASSPYGRTPAGAVSFNQSGPPWPRKPRSRKRVGRKKTTTPPRSKLGCLQVVVPRLTVPVGPNGPFEQKEPIVEDNDTAPVLPYQRQVSALARVLASSQEGSVVNPAPPTPAAGTTPIPLPQQATVVEGGVLNDKAISLPLVNARGPGVCDTGKVSVRVLVDETGSVVSAKAISGPILARAAAVSAARRAKFAPTQLNGRPVLVSGLLSYRFVRGKAKPIPGARPSNKNVLGSTDSDKEPIRVEKSMVMGIASEETGTAPSLRPPAAPPKIPEFVQGGVLNGKAINLPHPPYPAVARAASASGDVSVRVMVDEEGNVISAEAISGHPLLRASAVSAARGAKFSQTKYSGVPVKVSGVILYQYNLP